MSTTLLDPDDLDEVLAPNAGAAVIGYWRDIQAPSIAPAFEALTLEFAEDRVQMRRVDVERAPGLLEALGVRSLPTVVFCFNGEVVDAVVGRVQAQTLSKRVRWLLNRTPSHQGLFARLFGSRRVSG